MKVVIGLRADFYHLALGDLGERLAAGQIVLTPMSEQDLEQVIVSPAEKLLRSFQPGLIQRLVADVRGRPGDLPLLQFALTELWERGNPPRAASSPRRHTRIWVSNFPTGRTCRARKGR